MEKRRVVITGMGAITPLGKTAEDSWTAAKAGVCGIDTITLYDSSSMKVHLAGEVKDFNPEDYMPRREARRMDRFTQFAMVAADEAMKQSGLDLENEDTNRIGVILSSGIGGMSTIQSETLKCFERGNYDRISPFFIPMIIANMAAGQVAIKYGLHGMCTCPVSACASGSNAIGDAFRHIRDGYAEVMVCGGAEASLAEMGMGGFISLHAVSTATDPARASIPFDKERSGFVMGEGAGVLVLETYDHAKARGAKILGEIVGYGANCDAHHITAPCPDGSGAAACMTLAIQDAGISPDEVDYINAHGTSTPLNDSGETMAVKTAFGDHAYKLMMSSTKSMTGHLLGASGAVASIFSALALRDQFAPPTIHYQVPDEACDLDIIPNEGRSATLRYAMANAFGFGGHNACLIFKHWEE
ncbi:MAG TPA: beta-ketoacyl-ACP synthase II [Candidatus Flavonifractor merdipullorum]|uniref:3-oxoacyl-[acyl-carrier-protein] synthase 2 n=1 Tax=Candidatus Flavonifractor merdipullorum TaxID=2838590 RepID=A0A9D1UNS6_9FIRM|nr:beta-ketoacyl-ACP synthase II [Candidatus Flavonifractor merdipullorum]